MTQRSRPRILASLLAIVLVSPVPLAAQHEQEWTVVTLARDGSWGVGTSEHYGPALASALRKCEATRGAKATVAPRSRLSGRVGRSASCAAITACSLPQPT